MLMFATIGKAQLLSWSPSFIQENSPVVEITCDANLGNKGIKDYATTSDVYVHIGCITTTSTNNNDWKGVPFTWATTNVLAKTTYLGSNKWKYTINGGIRSFFNITNASEKILKIAILFRSGDGTKVLRNIDGSDMYIPVYDNGLYTRIDNPLRTPVYNIGVESVPRAVGDVVNIVATASSSSNISLFFNGTLASTTPSATTASASVNITNAGIQTIVSQATNGSTTSTDTVKFLVAGNVNIAPLPQGITKDGIYYDAVDNTAVTLVIYALGKQTVSVIGDFNNWTETLIHQMNRTSDGKYFWLRITGLTPTQEYGFQYIIDGSLKVADYNSEKILDPWNDQYISPATYPALKPYPTGLTSGIVGVLQTAKPAFNWQYPYTKNNKKNLIIYELLLRDFVSNHDFQTLKDSLPYLAKLGINAIQLMPVIEFEGNNSWGYNPNYFMALDKYYGTETAFKQFIDECHRNNIAVILDIAINHAFGSCPMVQMYFDGVNNRPTPSNPWFNTADKHPFGVGFDFNHEAQVTKDLVDRVINHWLTNYKVDGFRWDLSKGFTQKQSNDVGSWGNYDATRIAIWKRIYDKMQSISPNSYCILEHFADNNEEIELSNYGMLLWGNANYNFREAAKGSSSNTDFAYNAIAANRGWTNPYLVGYAESHDEERLMFDNLSNGNVLGSYNIKDTTTALKRQEMVAAFLSLIPGPKMIWQMGELGYDFSINTCTNGTINNNCRLDEKPIKWNYQQNASRKKLYNVYSKLFAIRNNPNFSSTFTTNPLISANFSSNVKQMIVGDGNLRLVVVGNFGLSATTASINFPNTGTWYDYLNGTTQTVTGTSKTLFLLPGEYFVLANKDINNIILSINNPQDIFNNNIDYKYSVVTKPNPINTSSVVEYSIPSYGKLSLKILDINGRIVNNVFNGYKSKGKYYTSIFNDNMKSVSNGLYFLEFDFNGKKQIEKLIKAN